MKQKLSKIKLATLTILTSTLLTMVACDKKDGGGSAAPAPSAFGSYGQGCSNCFANPMYALRGMPSFTFFYDATFSLDLLVGESGYAINWQDPLMLGFYSGPAALQGFLDIQSPSVNFCFIAAGRYAVTTSQAGMMSAKTLSNLRLNMVGPGGQIQATVISAELTNTLDATGPRIAMLLNLDSVNGYMCGQVQTAQF